MSLSHVGSLSFFVAHFSARLVRGLTHTKEIAKWASHHNIKEVFIVGGDADLPKHYPEALPFMKDFLDFAPGVHTVGGNIIHAASHCLNFILNSM